MAYIFTMEYYYPAMGKVKILHFDATCIELEIEMNQMEKDKK